MIDHTSIKPRFAASVRSAALALAGASLLAFPAPSSGDSSPVSPNPHTAAARPDGMAPRTRRRVKRRSTARRAPARVEQDADSRADSGRVADAPPAALADKVGVPECDEYIAKYEACVYGKVPENVFPTLRASFAAMRKAWRDAAVTPHGRAGVAQACKNAHEQAKTSLRSYGCNW